MAEYFDGPVGDGLESEFPRFLTSSVRDEALPSVINWAAQLESATRAGLIATASVVALGTHAFLAPEGSAHHAAAIPKVDVMPVRIVRQTSEPAPDADADTRRLSYASRMQDHLTSVREVTVADASILQADVAQDVPPNDLIKDETAQPEPASLLLVRNIPQGVTFQDGIAAGIGVWAIGAQTPEELVAAVKDAPSEPVAAEVEQINGAGVTLSTRTLTLQPKAPSVPLAAVEPSQQETVTAEEVAARAKPQLRKQVAHVRKKVAVVEEAAEEPPPRPKVKKRKRRGDDAYRPARSPPPEQAPADDVAEAQDDKPGPIAKFFTWLKGGNAKPGEDEAEKPAQMAKPNILERDGTLRGLGMSPVDE